MVLSDEGLGILESISLACTGLSMASGCWPILQLEVQAGWPQGCWPILQPEVQHSCRRPWGWSGLFVQLYRGPTWESAYIPATGTHCW